MVCNMETREKAPANCSILFQTCDWAGLSVWKSFWHTLLGVGVEVKVIMFDITNKTGFILSSPILLLKQT